MITDRLNIVIVSNDEQYSGAMQVRRAVFVNECNIPEEKEFDGNDYSATHILALDDNKPIGTMRIRYFNNFVKMERMCVLKDYRKTDVSEQIMQKAMLFASQKGYENVYGVCKKELLNRWQKNGFEQIAGAPVVEQNGQTLIPICCKLNKPHNVITMTTSASILNAKEGEWFNNEKSAAERIKALTDKVKLIKTNTTNSDKKWCTPLIYPLSHNTDDKSY